MKLLEKLVDLFCKWGWMEKTYVFQPSRQNCPHPESKKSFSILIGEQSYSFESSPMCPDCTSNYYNEFKTYCAECQLPILPGEPVAKASLGEAYPYTHIDTGCCFTVAMYCGIWGEGRLITLHEIDPEKYSEGTGSVVEQCLRSGQRMMENIKTK